MFDKKFEDLQLPTSRLVRRRRHLGRVYEQVTLIIVLLFQGDDYSLVIFKVIILLLLLMLTVLLMTFDS